MINRRIFMVLMVISVSVLAIAIPRSGMAQDRTSEPDFLSLWSTHVRSPQDHDGVSAACVAFKRAHPSSPFRTVSDSLNAWHLLAASKTNEAVTAFSALARSTKTGKLDLAAKDIARAWLSRIDREDVCLALEAEYVKQVEYPESLDVLRARPDAPRMKDRWGREWIYRQTGFRLLSGLQGQRYILESTRLKPNTDLRQALERSYGAELKLTIVKEISRTTGSEIIEVKIAPGSKTSDVTLSLGSTKRGLTYAYRGKGFMIFANDYWHVLGAR